MKKVSEPVLTPAFFKPPRRSSTLLSNGTTDPGYGDTLDAAHYGRLFVVAAGGSLTLQNMRLVNGYAYTDFAAGNAQGGAIENFGDLDLNHETVAWNQVIGNPFFGSI